MLELVEEAFDVVSLAIDRFRPAVSLVAVGFIGNVGDRALVTDEGADTIGVVALVGDDDGALLETLEQSLCRGQIVIVARRDQEADRAPFRIDAGVDLRGEAAAASTNTPNSTLFFTPEAC